MVDGADMFWSAVQDGLGLLLNWQVWVALLGYAFLWLAFMCGCGLAMGGKSAGRAVGGGFLYMLGGPVVQSILMGLLVVWLMPLFFGKDECLPLPVMASLAWPLTKIALLAMVIVFVLCIIPIIGGIISNIPGIQQYILSAMIFQGVLTPSLREVGVKSSNVYPSFWIAVAFAAVSIAMVYVVMMVTGMVMMKSRSIDVDPLTGEPRPPAYAPFLGAGVGLFGGLIPFFMYTQYVKASLGV